MVGVVIVGKCRRELEIVFLLALVLDFHDGRELLHVSGQCLCVIVLQVALVEVGDAVSPAAFVHLVGCESS